MTAAVGIAALVIDCVAAFAVFWTREQARTLDEYDQEN